MRVRPIRRRTIYCVGPPQHCVRDRATSAGPVRACPDWNDWMPRDSCLLVHAEQERAKSGWLPLDRGSGALSSAASPKPKSLRYKFFSSQDRGSRYARRPVCSRAQGSKCGRACTSFQWRKRFRRQACTQQRTSRHHRFARTLHRRDNSETLRRSKSRKSHSARLPELEDRARPPMGHHQR